MKFRVTVILLLSFLLLFASGIGLAGKKVEVSYTSVSKGDGEIKLSSLGHDREQLNYVNPLTEEKVRIKFKASRGDIEEVILYYNDGEEKKVKMENKPGSTEFAYYQAVIQTARDNFSYCFEIRDGNKSFWYGREGLKREKAEVDFINYELAREEIFSTPDWVKDAVFYQIFPDRFYNGNQKNDPEKIEVYKNEGELQEALVPDWDQGVPEGTSHVITDKSKFVKDSNLIKSNYGYHVFYGGDLQGIEEKIPYLKKLGVNAVCFTPLFEAASNHKFNVSDHKLIEDNFAVKGNQEASRKYLKELINKLHKNDIKVILSADFSCTGYEHWAFQDIVEKGEDSQYSDWYFIKDYPVKELAKQGSETPPNYRAQWGDGAYPILNVNNLEVKKYLFKAAEKWMDPDGDGDPGDGIDGWYLTNLEGVEEINPDFWKEWRKFVKDINPQIYISGETEADIASYFKGDSFDAVNSDSFRETVVDFIAYQKITAEKFGNRLAEINFQYPEQSRYAVQNLIGDINTRRFLTAAGGNKDRLKLASLFQMTYLGAPVIYYGDEVGIEGGSPPDSRRTMVWEDRGYTKPDKELFNHYQRLIEIRKQYPALRKGAIEPVSVEDEMVYAFKRSYQGEELLVIINAGTDKAEVAIPVDAVRKEYRELYTGKKVEAQVGKLRTTLEPVSGVVVKLK